MASLVTMSEEQLSEELLGLSKILDARAVPCLGLALKMLSDMPAEVAISYIGDLKELSMGENDCTELRSAIAALESFEGSQA